MLVSLFGAAIVASVLLWIFGDWSEDGGQLGVILRLIWAAWWVLAIATVLVRVALFGARLNRQRRERLQQGEARPPDLPAGVNDNPVGVEHSPQTPQPAPGSEP